MRPWLTPSLASPSLSMRGQPPLLHQAPRKARLTEIPVIPGGGLLQHVQPRTSDLLHLSRLHTSGVYGQGTQGPSADKHGPRAPRGVRHSGRGWPHRARDGPMTEALVHGPEGRLILRGLTLQRERESAFNAPIGNPFDGFIGRQGAGGTGTSHQAAGIWARNRGGGGRGDRGQRDRGQGDRQENGESQRGGNDGIPPRGTPFRAQRKARDTVRLAPTVPGISTRPGRGPAGANQSTNNAGSNPSRHESVSSTTLQTPPHAQLLCYRPSTLPLMTAQALTETRRIRRRRGGQAQGHLPGVPRSYSR